MNLFSFVMSKLRYTLQLIISLRNCLAGYLLNTFLYFFPFRAAWAGFESHHNRWRSSRKPGQDRETVLQARRSAQPDLHLGSFQPAGHPWVEDQRTEGNGNLCQAFPYSWKKAKQFNHQPHISQVGLGGYLTKALSIINLSKLPQLQHSRVISLI